MYWFVVCIIRTLWVVNGFLYRKSWRLKYNKLFMKSHLLSVPWLLALLWIQIHWNFDPDPGFWPNLDPGLYIHQFWTKKLKMILEKKNSLKKYIFLKLKEQNVTKRNFYSVESLNCEFKCYVLCLHFTLYLHVWIRIRIPNMDPDLEGSWIRIQYGSGSTTLIIIK